MATKARKGVVPTIINHREAARRCGVSTKMFRAYVERGIFPLPHSIIEPLWFYRLEVIEHYVEHGTWPADAKKRPPRRRAAGQGA